VALGNYPRLFPLYIRLKSLLARDNASSELLYRRRTELVIEGFPRSANTFAVVAFRMAQDRHVPIAHHLHAPSQIMCGVRDGKPVVVLIRRPVDAISSLLVSNAELTPRGALEFYVRFYETVWPLAEGCHVAPYESVIGRYDRVIRQLNARFGTTYGIFEPTESNVEACFRRIEEVAPSTLRGDRFELAVGRPSKQRRALKEAMARELGSPAYQALVGRAQAIHDKWISRSG
jgi:hypothetical protein